MPYLLKCIDQIAREKQRGALYVTFTDKDFGFDHENDSNRKQVISWLESKGIGWLPCGHVANPNVMGSYQGQIYIDLPYDTELPAYQKLEAYLQRPDDTMRIDGVTFYYLPLEVAMKNAYMDEPGYWDRWAEDF